MKIIVLGGGGFIGSHVADALSKKGHKVTIFDKKIWIYRIIKWKRSNFRYDKRRGSSRALIYKLITKFSKHQLVYWDLFLSEKVKPQYSFLVICKKY